MNDTNENKKTKLSWIEIEVIIAIVFVLLAIIWGLVNIVFSFLF